MTKKTRINKSRSRNGCLTCRQRHIKCDEALPVCKNCRRSNRTCERGCRFNFLKSITVTPHFPAESDFRRIRFMDQSLSIHKLYRCNNFHDYSQWLQFHTRQELRESDADIRDGETANETPSKNRLRISSVSVINDNSDSETSRQSSGTPLVFNLVNFVNKLLSIPEPHGPEQSLFVHSHKEILSGLVCVFNPRPVVDDKFTLYEFANIMDRLEGEFFSNSTDPVTFQVNYSVLLNALVLSSKAGKIDLFDESFVASKMICILMEANNVDLCSSPYQLALFEQLHNYGNMMNYYELLLLDLNDSLKFNKPNSMRTDAGGMCHMFAKAQTFNLFDDLNFFLISITTILLKLNNLRHHRYKNHFELEQLIKDLKEFENNQFLTDYYPQIHEESSVSSTSSSESMIQIQTLMKKTSHFDNLKTRRIHTYYNFILWYLHRHFPLTQNLKNLLYAPTPLNQFWNHVEANLDKRVRQLSIECDFTSDPFMSFLRRL